MSSFPGPTLEDYLAWNYDVVVIGQGEANPSLGIAEVLGTATKVRHRLTKEQFKSVVDVFETWRGTVEHILNRYNEEDHGGWRQYSNNAFDDAVPLKVYTLAKEKLNEAIAKMTTEYAPMRLSAERAEELAKEKAMSFKPKIDQALALIEVLAGQGRRRCQIATDKLSTAEYNELREELMDLGYEVSFSFEVKNTIIVKW